MVVLALFQLGIGGTGLSALAGALFIAPYVLLSAPAGQLADRFSKPHLIVAYKLAEVLLMTGAAGAFLTASVPGLLIVLTGLGIQATLFGPVKYGIIPEHLDHHDLVAGNGVIEATTFLSIVAGTVAGGALILLPYGTAWVSAVGMALAVLGVWSALRIPAAPPGDPSLRVSPNFIAETWRITRHAALLRPIWFAILGLSWFWTIGAALITEFPVIARDTLGSDGTVLTLLLTVFALGVGFGSMQCARLLHGHISARIVPFAGIGIRYFAGITPAPLHLQAPSPPRSVRFPLSRAGASSSTCSYLRHAAASSRCRSMRSFRTARRPPSARAWWRRTTS